MLVGFYFAIVIILQLLILGLLISMWLRQTRRRAHKEVTTLDPEEELQHIERVVTSMEKESRK